MEFREPTETCVRQARLGRALTDTPKSQELQTTKADFSFTRPVRCGGLCSWKPRGLLGAGAPSSVALTATVLTTTDLGRASLWRVSARARQVARATSTQLSGRKEPAGGPEIKGPGCVMTPLAAMCTGRAAALPRELEAGSQREEEKLTMASDSLWDGECSSSPRPRAWGGARGMHHALSLWVSSGAARGPQTEHPQSPGPLRRWGARPSLQPPCSPKTAPGRCRLPSWGSRQKPLLMAMAPGARLVSEARRCISN